ncbi:uncharacterized protein [Pyxicephalus adspersus]|uniref:uncharacterized protein n=1 Tax=Pyxicephalus adspersus TaxID=30357 RepID=UPI003B5BC21E
MEAEWQLFRLCQGPFIELLERFNKADILGNGNISQEDFKEIIENTVQVQLTPAHIRSFVALLGNQESNCISVMNFLALIQDRPTTSELKEEIARLSSQITVHHRIDKIRYQKNFEMDLSRYTNAQIPRNLQELYVMVWNLLQHKFWQFCKVFINTCRNDECSADKEKLDAIFLRMNCVLLPEELENLWHSLPITYPVESISFKKFLSYFVNMKTPKESGTRRTSPVEAIQAQLTTDIVKYWKEIKSILRSRDPLGTGQVSFTEICAIFFTLKVKIGPSEFDTLCQAFDLNQDGNFHYIRFLKFYIKKNNSLH